MRTTSIEARQTRFMIDPVTDPTQPPSQYGQVYKLFLQHPSFSIINVFQIEKLTDFNMTTVSTDTVYRILVKSGQCINNDRETVSNKCFHRHQRNFRFESRQTPASKKLSCSVFAGTHRRDHIKPVLARLHWLPMRARLTFKIVTVVVKIRRSNEPSYLADMVEEFRLQRTLRSSFHLLFKEPTFQAVTRRRSF